MPTQGVEFEVAGKTYGLRFTSNALFKLEEKSGRSVPEMLVAFNEGRCGVRDIQLMFWAALEGHRLKSKPRSSPYTVEEAGDIIDDAGGFREVADLLTTAITQGLQRSAGKTEGEEADPTTPPQGN